MTTDKRDGTTGQEQGKDKESYLDSMVTWHIEGEEHWPDLLLLSMPDEKPWTPIYGHDT